MMQAGGNNGHRTKNSRILRIDEEIKKITVTFNSSSAPMFEDLKKSPLAISNATATLGEGHGRDSSLCRTDSETSQSSFGDETFSIDFNLSSPTSARLAAPPLVTGVPLSSGCCYDVTKPKRQGKIFDETKTVSHRRVPAAASGSSCETAASITNLLDSNKALSIRHVGEYNVGTNGNRGVVEVHAGCGDNDNATLCEKAVPKLKPSEKDTCPTSPRRVSTRTTTAAHEIAKADLLVVKSPLLVPKTPTTKTPRSSSRKLSSRAVQEQQRAMRSLAALSARSQAKEKCGSGSTTLSSLPFGEDHQIYDVCVEDSEDQKDTGTICSLPLVADLSSHDALSRSEHQPPRTPRHSRRKLSSRGTVEDELSQSEHFSRHDALFRSEHQPPRTPRHSRRKLSSRGNVEDELSQSEHCCRTPRRASPRSRLLCGPSLAGALQQPLTPSSPTKKKAVVRNSRKKSSASSPRRTSATVRRVCVSSLLDSSSASVCRSELNTTVAVLEEAQQIACSAGAE